MVIPSYDPCVVLDNMRINLKRDLYEVRSCRAHSHRMSVAGGGPSLDDTKDKLSGYVCAVNGSMRYLREQGIDVHACGILDPSEHIADSIDAIDGVHYYVASMAHPSVFEKLKNCHVVMWHPSGAIGAEEFLRVERPDDWFMVGGGSTMGVRWLNLGYVCGFREFHVHGLDSSYRDGKTHAYDEHDRKDRITVGDRETSPNFLQQVDDFASTMERFSQNDMEKIRIKLYGEGLLQDVNNSLCQ